MRHRTGDKRPPAVDVAVGDHVLCRGGGSAQEGCCYVSVAKVLSLRKDSAGELYMLCRWYSRPEQAASGRLGVLLRRSWVVLGPLMGDVGSLLAALGLLFASREAQA